MMKSLFYNGLGTEFNGFCCLETRLFKNILIEIKQKNINECLEGAQCNEGVLITLPGIFFLIKLKFYYLQDIGDIKIRFFLAILIKNFACF